MKPTHFISCQSMVHSSLPSLLVTDIELLFIGTIIIIIIIYIWINNAVSMSILWYYFSCVLILVMTSNEEFDSKTDGCNNFQFYGCYTS